MLIYCLIIISYYYQCWKWMCCLIFLWKQWWIFSWFFMNIKEKTAFIWNRNVFTINLYVLSQKKKKYMYMFVYVYVFVCVLCIYSYMCILYMAIVLMTAGKLHKFVQNLMIRVSLRELSIFKTAVRKFCLFVAISVWKPGIAVSCGIIFRAWGCAPPRLQRGWI